jgi:hypothetical protein
MKKFLTLLLALAMIFTASNVFAAATTYVFYDGTVAGTSINPQMDTQLNYLTVRRVIVDLANQTLDAGEGDIAQVIPIPAGTVVLSAWIRIITAETANGTLDLGWGTNPDEWGDALAVDATAGTIAGAINDWVPLYFSAADTIDLTATTDTADIDLDGLKVEVTAVMLRVQDTY